MSASRDFVDNLITNRDLISVRRRHVDKAWIQGFPLAISKKLILLQYVYDFHLDGYIVLRLRDISDWKVGDTNVFQRRLLQTEGVLDKVKFDFRAPIDSYPDLLASFPSHQLVIIESEKTDPPEMLLGTVPSIQRQSVAINYITGIARQTTTSGPDAGP